MGARPIALMDPLRFGPLNDARNRWVASGVVSGISGYGNAVGVPTVGGELEFASCYAGNPLVNVLCCGVLPKDRLVFGRAAGEGNLAVLLGSTTGRDGIGGVSVLASAAFSDDPDAEAAKRPNVQVGDPFEEKRLIEATPRIARQAPGIGDTGPRRRRPHLCHERDRFARRRGYGRERRRRAATRAGPGALRSHDEREPRAHAGNRHAGNAQHGVSRYANAGKSGPLSWAKSPARAAYGC